MKPLTIRMEVPSRVRGRAKGSDCVFVCAKASAIASVRMHTSAGFPIERVQEFASENPHTDTHTD